MNNQDPFVIFNNNIERATKFLQLAELKELRERLSLPIIKQIRLIRQVIEKRTSEMYEVGLPQVLVYSVSCLEAYLKDYYYFTLKKIGIEYQETRFWWNDILQKYEDLVEDIFEGNKELLFDVEEIREKRHVVIHNSGIVDSEAIKRIIKNVNNKKKYSSLQKQITQHKIREWESMENEKLSLESKIIENDIKTIKRFVELIQKKTTHIYN